MDAQDQDIAIIFARLFLFIGVVTGLSIWGYTQGKKRTIGSTGGLLLGMFLGLIGIIIVYCINRIDDHIAKNMPAGNNRAVNPGK